MSLEKRFREVERMYQSYQAQPTLDNMYKLEEALGEMDTELGEMIEETEENS